MLYLFLGPDVFAAYFGDRLGENIQHTAGFFLLSAATQAFETPVIQGYCRVRFVLCFVFRVSGFVFRVSVLCVHGWGLVHERLCLCIELGVVC